MNPGLSPKLALSTKVRCLCDKRRPRQQSKGKAPSAGFSSHSLISGEFSFRARCSNVLQAPKQRSQNCKLSMLHFGVLLAKMSPGLGSPIFSMCTHSKAKCSLTHVRMSMWTSVGHKRPQSSMATHDLSQLTDAED